MEQIKNRLPCGCFNECDDMGHFWRDVRKSKQKKKSRNETSSTNILIKAGIKFKSFNCGNHLQLEDKTNFWPSTGKWIRPNGEKGRGVFNLLMKLREYHS